MYPFNNSSQEFSFPIKACLKQPNKLKPQPDMTSVPEVAIVAQAKEQTTHNSAAYIWENIGYGG